MQAYIIDPLSDSRWRDLAASHPSASAFHQPGWLNALAATYAYRPIALTSTPPGEVLRDGLVFCEVRSLITGNRLVSLPFSDHAEPFMEDSDAFFGMMKWFYEESKDRNWKYIEIRPISRLRQTHPSLAQNQSFWFHTLDLAPAAEHLFRNLHKSCMQRRIRHAEQQKLTYERGSSAALLDDFYKLLLLTRKRFGLPPQPRAWFQNVLACVGPSAEIRLAKKGNRPIAGIFTLRHRGTVIYKYGCSDEKYHNLAGIPFLFWKLIEESRSAGAELLDLGRTDLDNEGLIQFKERLGAVRAQLNYFRYPERANEAGANLSSARGVFSKLPYALSSWLGRMAYRHIG